MYFRLSFFLCASYLCLIFSLFPLQPFFFISKIYPRLFSPLQLSATSLLHLSFLLSSQLFLQSVVYFHLCSLSLFTRSLSPHLYISLSLPPFFSVFVSLSSYFSLTLPSFSPSLPFSLVFSLCDRAGSTRLSMTYLNQYKLFLCIYLVGSWLGTRTFRRRLRSQTVIYLRKPVLVCAVTQERFMKTLGCN